MLMLGKEGKIRADAVKVGDLLLSRNELDPNGPLAWKRVQEVFVRVAPIWAVKIPGQTIETTAEHPFWVFGRGWIPTRMLEVGDLFITDDGLLVTVEGVADTGRVETVYNFLVEDFHTYFVSETAEGVSVWVHNTQVYHGTDTDSAHDIEKNGLSKKKWKQHVDEGGDPSGFSVTEDIGVARQHAQKSATLRGKKGAVIAADDGDLPNLQTGTGPQGFDPGESKIPPKNINKKDVGPGVFKVVEDNIPPL